MRARDLPDETADDLSQPSRTPALFLDVRPFLAHRPSGEPGFSFPSDAGGPRDIAIAKPSRCHVSDRAKFIVRNFAVERYYAKAQAATSADAISPNSLMHSSVTRNHVKEKHVEHYEHERRRVLDEQHVSIWLRSALTALDNLPADEANLLLMLTALR